jgi:Na+/H+ antiporter NhaD/arsenite permease-like protein
MNIIAEENLDNTRHEAPKSYLKMKYFIFASLIFLAVVCFAFVLEHILDLAKQVNDVMYENKNLEAK